jgi:predicted metal-dependent enzyme (double-stranded beta helix superfamily)
MNDEAGAPEKNKKSCPALFHNDEVFMSFCDECNEAVGTIDTSSELVDEVVERTKRLVKEWRMPDPRYLACQPDAMYGSYLLYLNSSATLNVVLDVFMPGQAAMIHNHKCWCAFACLEGVERERLYSVDSALETAPVQELERICAVGEVRALGGARNLFHQVECGSDSPAVSLHVYGADIGRLERDVWNEEKGQFVSFRSNYSNDAMGLPEYYLR